MFPLAACIYKSQYISTLIVPISYIGYVGVSNNNLAQNSDIAVPAGATLAVLGIAYHYGGADGTINAISLGGTAMTHIGTTTYNSGYMQVRLYWVACAAGTRNFTCTWAGGPANGIRYMFQFFSGANASPIRDWDFAASASTNQTLTTPNIDSSATDVLAVFAAGYNRAEDCTMTGGGQTSVDSGQYNNADYGAAYKAGTGTTDTATAILSTGSIAGVTLKM